MPTTTADALKARVNSDFKSNSKTRINVFRKFFIDLIDLLYNQPGSTVQDYENLRNQIFGTLDDPQLQQNLGQSNILSYLLQGLKVKFIELPTDVNISSYVSDYGLNPAVDTFFTVAPNETLFIKQKVQNNDADIYDGWQIYVFKKGAGKWGVKNQNSTATDIKPCYMADFVLISKSDYANEVIFSNYQYLELQTNLMNYSSNEIGYPFPTVHQIGHRILTHGLTKLDQPDATYNYGKTRDRILRNGIMVYPLNIKLPHFDAIEKFIAAGGKVSIMMYRQKYKRGDGSQNHARNTRWSFAEGDVPNILPVTKASDLYDFKMETWFSGYTKDKLFVGPEDDPQNHKKIFINFKLKYEIDEQTFYSNFLGDIKVIWNQSANVISYGRC